MSDEIRIGIIICDRYRGCAGGKCLRALNNREGAFSIYEGKEVKLVGYTACGGCPGGNIEYAPEEVVGYPPCPRVTHFRDFIREKYGLNVVIGTHPIPQNYYETHTALGTWNSPRWTEIIQPTLADEETRLLYD